MVKNRASIFDDVAEAKPLDLRGFKPKAAADDSAPSPEQVREVSLAAQFRSRESKPSAPQPKAQPQRNRRQHRTGRNVQLNIKVTQEANDTFYAITDAHPGWVLGYTFERAVDALKRELEGQAPIVPRVPTTD